jgi:ribonucleoside-diphosphate reductase alpha subunit
MSDFSTADTEMFVQKRNGQKEIVSFDKILKRIKTVGQEVGIQINYTTLVIKVIDQLYDGISSSKIDDLLAEQCASLASTHPDYNVLAGRIAVSSHQKNTPASFLDAMTALYEYKDKHGLSSPLVSNELFAVTTSYTMILEAMLNYERDYLIDYFGFKTLDRAYLMKVDGKTVERPQHMWLRVAIGIHGQNIDRVKETYDLMSQKYFTHATPTLFNAGTLKPQLSSCFLLAMEQDSIDGIYSTLKDCALISKWAGGIGLHIHNVRAKGSHIRGTNGSSNGIVPMLRVFNNTAKYVDQCLHPETIIYTTQGPKQIQNCVVGETEIFNLNGDSETIQNVLEHSYDGEFLEIDSMHSLHPMRISPEHPVYALRGQKKGLGCFAHSDEGGISETTDDVSSENTSNYKVIKNRLEKNICQFEWTDAKDLTTTDMLIYPMPTYSRDISTISADDCYMYGVILGDGSMSNSTDSAGYVSIHTTNKKKIADFMETYFTKNLVQYFKKVDGNTTQIRWNRNIHLPFRYNDFYDETKQKRVQARWLNLPLDKAKFILKGLIDTDGCVSSAKAGEVVFDSTSLNLIESVRFLCLKLGVLTSGYIRDRIGESHETARGTIENKKISYCLRIPKTKDICDLINIDYDDSQFFNFMRHGEFLLSRIQDIRTTVYQGVLYDLQMPKEHNYLIENGLVHNGGGKRNGSFAIYLEPWHADVEAFLQMRKNHGDEELKARDLFYALWIPDLFMDRVKSDGPWTLMCPDECPGLAEVYGDEFVALYTKYESEGRGRTTMKARQLWFQILDAQMETGTPYILYKDACNKKSNQKNLGTIKSSNLCSEIVQYSDDNESAVCNLASIALPSFLDSGKFDFEKLHQVARVVTYNLNRVIDVNYYPTEKTRRSNVRHRPIGIGIQGLADVFMILGLPFASEEARELNRQIFETIYHAAVEESCFLAKSEGAYETFVGSPASQGLLQFDLWSVDPGQSRYDWSALKSDVMKYGLRNSLLLAPMPTASTSQILGFNECIEPITSNIYSRRTLAGEFILANKYLMKDLIDLNLWNEKIKNNIIANHGSIQHIDLIPPEIKEKYKTVWEIPMRALIDMAADRGAYVCQSQSLNLWLEDPNYNSLTSMHFYSWSKGLKTGIYYLRRRGRHQAQQFTIEPERGNGQGVEEEQEICEMCSA